MALLLAALDELDEKKEGTRGRVCRAENCVTAGVALRQCNYLSGETTVTQLSQQEGRRRGAYFRRSAAGAICPYCKGIRLEKVA